MSWKYVLFGLVLILPRIELIAEGRKSEELKDGRGVQSVLSSIREYFSDQALIREPYNVAEDDEDEGAPSTGRESQGKAPGPDDRDTTNHHHPQPPNPLPREGDRQGSPGASKKEKKAGEEVGGRKAGAPLALALSQSEPSDGSKAGGQAAIHAQSMAFIVIVAGCSMLAAVGLIGAGVCWYKYHRKVKSASVVDYPAYGVTGPAKDRFPSPGDRKLAQSAQMYHYQHQKQQMIAMEKANGSMKHDASDEESEEDNVEGDYTVYECPGLAPTGEMEVKNPLFRGDETPEPSTPVNEDPPPPEDK